MAQISGCSKTVTQLNQITGCTDFDSSFLLLIVDTINGETMNIPAQKLFDCMGDDNFYLTAATLSASTLILEQNNGTTFYVDFPQQQTYDFIYLAPEYPNTVFTTFDGTNDISVTPKFDPVNLLNYYEILHETGSTSDQKVTITIQLLTPQGLTSFGSLSGVYYWFSGGSTASIDLSIYDTTNTMTFSGTTTLYSGNTWFFNTGGLPGTYTPGEPFIISIEPTIKEKQEVRIGPIKIKYNKS